MAEPTPHPTDPEADVAAGHGRPAPADDAATAPPEDAGSGDGALPPEPDPSERISELESEAARR